MKRVRQVLFLTEIRFLSKRRSINYYSKIMNPQVHTATIISKIIIFYHNLGAKFQKVQNVTTHG